MFESVYSMDGDTAPLGDLAAIADRYDGILLIDEAQFLTPAQVDDLLRLTVEDGIPVLLVDEARPRA